MNVFKGDTKAVRKAGGGGHPNQSTANVPKIKWQCCGWEMVGMVTSVEVAFFGMEPQEEKNEVIL